MVCGSGDAADPAPCWGAGGRPCIDIVGDPESSPVPLEGAGSAVAAEAGGEAPVLPPGQKKLKSPVALPLSNSAQFG